MASPTTIPPVIPPGSPRGPLLEQGDHLTREEFERRYDAIPGLKKAELIEGVVYMPSPVRLGHHGSPHIDLATWIGVYRASTPGVRAGDNTSVRLDPTNEPQPDALMLIEPACGGQARITADDYVEGGPELVAEVAASSVSIDLNLKFRVYRRCNVREYIVWRVTDQQIDWFVLRGPQYERLPPGPDGHYRSEVFPGLWLDVAALIRGDLATVLQVLQRGVASSEHAAFVARLQQAAGGNP
ncbi:MAG TPA: Uma2 family endonuclease [Gemmataceae bacterium]|nr:Uma2 family endonuclease [Gemmataceae bacterium]